MGNIGSSGGASRGPPPPPPLDGHGHGVPPPYYHRYPPWAPGAAAPPPVAVPVHVERHRAVAVHSGVNVKGETLRLEPDDDGRRLLLAFSFDADAPGSITVYFFAQEDDEFVLKATKENLLQPVTVTFKEGQGQEFKQPSGTGIDVSVFDESELTKVGEGGVFPVAFKVQVDVRSNQELEGAHEAEESKSLVKFAVFVKKDNAEYRVHVVQQILWVNGTRYVLQEIYGIGNTADRNHHEDDSGKECVICLSEPRDTTVLPCRHMDVAQNNSICTSCGIKKKKMKAAVQTELTHIRFYSATVISEGTKCEASLTVEAVDDATFFNFDDHNISICQNTTESAACLCRECAQLLRFQTNKCPICRRPVERLLEIEVDSKPIPHQGAQ